MSDLQTVESSVSIVDIVSRYRTVIPAGKNFKSLCPFHDDHTPSLIINPVQNFAWCFACQNGGNVFSFIQKIEGISFKESVKLVGEIGGIDTSFLDNYNNESKDKKDYKERLKDLLDVTQSYFVKNFYNNSIVQDYFYKERRLSKLVANDFGVGYAENSFDNLKNFLLKKGFSVKEMLDSGVIKQNGENFIDKYRNRLMFPIKNNLGKVCGFAGRTIGEDDPKYLNSPNTILYDKSNILFGIFESKESIRKNDMVILVEGNIDVIACHNYGIKNVVAISGVAISDDQILMLKRFCTKISLALDTDEAGIKAAERILPLLLQKGFSVFWVNISDAKDPDEALKNNANKFIENIKNRELAFLLLLKKYIEKFNIDNIDSKKKIMRKIFPILESFASKIEQSEMLNESSILLKIDKVLLEDEFFKFLSSKSAYKKKEKIVENSKNSISKKMYFWGVLLSFFSECSFVFEKIQPEYFLEEEEKDLYSFLKYAYNKNCVVDMKGKLSSFSEKFRDDIQKSILFAQNTLGNYSTSQRNNEIIHITGNMGKYLINEMKKKISTKPEYLSCLHSALKSFH